MSLASWLANGWLVEHEAGRQEIANLLAIATAAQFVRTGMYENVLVIGADTFSKITDWNRRGAQER